MAFQQNEEIEMKNTSGQLTLIIGFIVIGLGLVALGLSIYGIVLAFSAHVVLGLICIFAHPLPFILGASQLLGFELAQHIVEWFERLL
jgi:hypothetical protein